MKGLSHTLHRILKRKKLIMKFMALIGFKYRQTKWYNHHYSSHFWTSNFLCSLRLFLYFLIYDFAKKKYNEFFMFLLVPTFSLYRFIRTILLINLLLIQNKQQKNNRRIFFIVLISNIKEVLFRSGKILVYENKWKTLTPFKSNARLYFDGKIFWD